MNDLLEIKELFYELPNDISRCTAKNCRLKKSCARYMSIPNSDWTAYVDFSNYIQNNICESFIKY